MEVHDEIQDIISYGGYDVIEGIISTSTEKGFRLKSNKSPRWQKHRTENQIPCTLKGKKYIVTYNKGQETTAQLLDTKGDTIIPPIYHSLSASKTGLLIAYNQDEKCGIINLQAQELVPCVYSWLRDLDTKHELFLYTERWPLKNFGIVSSKGEIITKPEYEYISHFQDGLAIVGKREKESKSEKITWKYGVINLKGKLVIPLQYSNIIKHFENGVAIGVMDDRKRTILKPK